MKNLLLAGCLLTPMLLSAQNVGINNDNPQAQLHINGGDLVVASDTGFGSLRMHFLVGREGAFRVGQRPPTLDEGSTDQWNGASVGTASFAANIATIASANGSTAFGTNTRATGPFSFATGNQTQANGQLSATYGFQTIANSFGSIAIGRYNADQGSSFSWNTTDPILTIGNGTSNVNRRNALTLLKDGRLGLNNDAPTYWITLSEAGLGIHRPALNILAFMTDGTERMRVNPIGRIGMGTPSPSEVLDVNGNARFRSIGSGASAGALNRTSNGTLTTATSDARLKTEIVPIENALEKAMGMRGVTFRWLQDPALGQCIGFIAQEVEKVAPELVFTNEVDGLKGVHYPETTALLLEALRQQQEMIDGMNATIGELKTEVELLKRNQN